MENEMIEIEDVLDILISYKGRIVEGRLYRWDENPDDINQVKLQLAFYSNKFEAVSEEGYFRALLCLRAQLEKLDTYIICYGASKCVYPSPMTESMGYGDKAYKLKLGFPAKSADLVSIFDTEQNLQPPSIKEQELFYALWLNSILNGND